MQRTTHEKRTWCWERLRAGGEGDDRGWDGWMASPTQWTWVWVDSRSWWWRGRPGVLWFMGSQRVGHNWATELNWIEKNYYSSIHISLGCSLWLSFYTSEASPEWSNLIYWLKSLCASFKMYCRDLFSFQGYMSNNLLGFLLYPNILQIFFKANPFSCLS